MNIDALIGLATQGLLLCLYVSLPIVVIAAGVGLVISFLQAVTSLQDQTLSFGVKLVAVVVALVVAAPISAAAVLRFANQVLQAATSQ
ncbi:type III secretion system export apparatus subunit SctS [Paraburkholderia strydomiana]|uniref:type III secretion system export apparatus subunit SctS n=1 Tax=Paraburkholderia strydomiana TaxID=1245417 RepID=UPI001BE53889|nr:type III secretion system export apparatus subunit SctS [Paraburkholderia strydomiana]MBT2793408.1 type III secretion system export apparatus subunit SctS [Paraburkholderia strydomiana]